MAYELKRMEGQTALVTGGLGFIGSNIAHKLVELGARVKVVDACIDPYGWNMANLKGIEDKSEFVKADIRDKEAMEKAVEGVDCVFNCAAQVSHIDSMSDPYLDIDINCRGNMTLLEALRKKNDKAKVVYAGTRGQLGAMEYSPADEMHPDRPTDIYGVNKTAGEKYHLVYNKAYGMPATSIRINNSFGERHQMKHGKYGIMNWFIRLALEDKEITVYGDGSQKRDYNYIADVVDAMILAAQADKTNGKYYYIGSGEPITFMDMTKKIIQAVGKGQLKQVPWPPERKAIEVGDFFVTFKAFSDDTGWEPRTGFDDGLRKTVEFYKQNLQEYV